MNKKESSFIITAQVKKRLFASGCFAAITTLTQLVSNQLSGLGAEVPILLQCLTWFFGSFIFAFFLYQLFDLFHPQREKARIAWLFLSSKGRCIMFAVFCACWSIYLFFAFPGFQQGDVSKQILMAFGYPIYGQNQVLADGVNVMYNGAFSLLTTFVYSGFYRLGLLLGSLEAGLAAFTILHVLMTACIYTWSIRTFVKNGVSCTAGLVLFLISLLSPILGMYVIDMSADVDYSLAMLVFFVLIFQIVASTGTILKKRSFLIKLGITSLLMCLLKAPGFLIVACIFLCLFLTYKKMWKKFLIVFLVLSLLFQVGVKNVAYTALKVAPVGKQESLSVPFLQTARFLRDYEGTISPEEMDTIKKVLNTKKVVKAYNAGNVNAVKGSYKKKSSREDLINYFGVWAKQFVQAPEIYVKAFLSHSYQYFSLTDFHLFGDYWIHLIKTYYKDYYDVLYKNTDITYEDLAYLDYISARQHKNSYKMRVFFLSIQRMPVFGSLFSLGFYSLVLFMTIVYFVYAKKRKNLLCALIPLLTVIGCCFSPVNGNFRYMLPAVLIIPFLVTLIFRAPEIE